jgi:hypothetical protein
LLGLLIGLVGGCGSGPTNQHPQALTDRVSPAEQVSQSGHSGLVAAVTIQTNYSLAHETMRIARDEESDDWEGAVVSRAVWVGPDRYQCTVALPVEARYQLSLAPIPNYTPNKVLGTTTVDLHGLAPGAQVLVQLEYDLPAETGRE